MIRLSPPDTHGYVQVERPVLDGHKRFLATSQEIGRRILGDDIVGSISDVSVDFFDGVDETMEPLHVETPVGTPRFETSSKNDLVLVLFHRGVRNDLSSRYGLLKAYSTLGREHDRPRYRPVVKPDGTTDRAQVPHPPLMRELRELSEKNNLDHEYTAISCDRVERVNVPGDNIIVGLSVSPATIAAKALADQAKKTYDTLVDEKSRLVQTSTASQITIPFARFPASVSNRDYQRIFDSLEAEVSTYPVRMHVGEPRVAIY